MNRTATLAGFAGVLLALSTALHAEPLMLKCPWQTPTAQADLLIIDVDAKTFVRQVIDAGDNIVWSSEPMPLQVTEDRYVGLDPSGDSVELNRYTGARSAQTGDIRTVLKCEKYQKGQRKY